MSLEKSTGVPAPSIKKQQRLMGRNECLACENYARKIREIQQTVSGRDIIIDMLQKQIKKCELNYKRLLEDYEQLRYRYCTTDYELTSLKDINEKLEMIGGLCRCKPSNIKPNSAPDTSIWKGSLQEELENCKEECQRLKAKLNQIKENGEYSTSHDSDKNSKILELENEIKRLRKINEINQDSKSKPNLVEMCCKEQQTEMTKTINELQMEIQKLKDKLTQLLDKQSVLMGQLQQATQSNGALSDTLVIMTDENKQNLSKIKRLSDQLRKANHDADEFACICNEKIDCLRSEAEEQRCREIKLKGALNHAQEEVDELKLCVKELTEKNKKIKGCCQCYANGKQAPFFNDIQNSQEVIKDLNLQLQAKNKKIAKQDEDIRLLQKQLGDIEDKYKNAKRVRKDTNKYKRTSDFSDIAKPDISATLGKKMRKAHRHIGIQTEPREDSGSEGLILESGQKRSLISQDLKTIIKPVIQRSSTKGKSSSLMKQKTSRKSQDSSSKTPVYQPLMKSEFVQTDQIEYSDSENLVDEKQLDPSILIEESIGKEEKDVLDFNNIFSESKPSNFSSLGKVDSKHTSTSEIIAHPVSVPSTSIASQTETTPSPFIITDALGLVAEPDSETMSDPNISSIPVSKSGDSAVQTDPITLESLIEVQTPLDDETSLEVKKSFSTAEQETILGETPTDKVDKQEESSKEGSTSSSKDTNSSGASTDEIASENEEHQKSGSQQDISESPETPLKKKKKKKPCCDKKKKEKKDKNETTFDETTNSMEKDNKEHVDSNIQLEKVKSSKTEQADSNIQFEKKKSSETGQAESNIEFEKQKSSETSQADSKNQFKNEKSSATGQTHSMSKLEKASSETNKFKAPQSLDGSTDPGTKVRKQESQRQKNFYLMLLSDPQSDEKTEERKELSKDTTDFIKGTLPKHLSAELNGDIFITNVLGTAMGSEPEVTATYKKDSTVVDKASPDIDKGVKPVTKREPRSISDIVYLPPGQIRSADHPSENLMHVHEINDSQRETPQDTNHSSKNVSIQYEPESSIKSQDRARKSETDRGTQTDVTYKNKITTTSASSDDELSSTESTQTESQSSTISNLKMPVSMRDVGMQTNPKDVLIVSGPKLFIEPTQEETCTQSDPYEKHHWDKDTETGLSLIVVTSANQPPDLKLQLDSEGNVINKKPKIPRFKDSLAHFKLPEDTEFRRETCDDFKIEKKPATCRTLIADLKDTIVRQNMEIAGLKEQNQGYKDKLDSLEKKKSDEIFRMREQIVKSQNNVDALIKDHSEKNSQFNVVCEQLQTLKNALAGDNNKYQKHIKELQDENGTLKTDVQEVLCACTKLGAEIEKLKIENAKKQEIIDELEDTVDNSKDILEQCAKKVNDLVAENESLRYNERELENKVQDAAEDIDRLKKAVSNSVQDAQKNLEESDKEKAKLKQQIQILQNDIKFLSEKCVTQCAQIQAEQKRTSIEQDKAIETINDLDEQKEKYRKLQKEYNDIQGQNRKLKNDLEKCMSHIELVEKEAAKITKQAELDQQTLNSVRRESLDDYSKLKYNYDKLLEKYEHQTKDLEKYKCDFEGCSKASKVNREEYNNLKREYKDIKKMLADQIQKYKNNNLLDDKSSNSNICPQLKQRLLEKEKEIQILNSKLHNAAIEIIELKDQIHKLTSDYRVLKTSINNLITDLERRIRGTSSGDRIQNTSVESIAGEILISLNNIESKILKKSSTCPIRECDCISEIVSSVNVKERTNQGPDFICLRQCACDCPQRDKPKIPPNPSSTDSDEFDCSPAQLKKLKDELRNIKSICNIEVCEPNACPNMNN